MKTSWFRKLLVGTALPLWLPFSEVRAYLTDGKVYSPPSYFTFTIPGVGGSYLDPVFNSRILRISDALKQPNTADLGNLLFIIHEYSTMSPFNSNNSRILLLHQGHFALYNGEGLYLKDLPFEIHATSEPRWARHDADTLYYVAGNRLKRYSVATGTISVVRTFGEYSTLSGLGESDISRDGDHLVFVGDSRDVFLYEISTDTKGAVLNTSGRGGFDHVHLTPRNNVLIGWFAIGSQRYAGIELYDRNMNFLRQVSPAIGHMDVTQDPGGNEVLLLANAAEPGATCPGAVVKVSLANGRKTCLISFDPSLAIHISAPDTSAWFVVSTYAPGDPTPLLGWTRYTNEILQVKIDGTEIRRLAHHRSRPFNAYNYTPRASVSRDGTRLVYSSNYGLQAILGLPPEYSDVFLMPLPSNPIPTPRDRDRCARLAEKGLGECTH